MSLINDALKRASRNQKERAADRPEGEPPMRYAVPSRASSTRLPMAIGAVLCATVFLSGVLLTQWQARRSGNLMTAVETPASTPGTPAGQNFGAAVPATASAEADVEPAASIPPETRPGALTAGVSRAGSGASPAPVTAAPAGDPDAGPADEFPSLRLQGILFRAADPTALINGRTVGVGGSLDEVRVRRIDADSVTVEWKGATRVLRIGH